MTYVVPFDGTPLARAALSRADEFAAAMDAPVLAVTVVPRGNTAFARERDLLDDDEPFDLETVVERLRAQVEELCPGAKLQVEPTDRYAPPGQIASDIRDMATAAGATLVVIGSENAGRMVSTISTIGGSVATDDEYDVLIVRHDSD